MKVLMSANTFILVGLNDVSEHVVFQVFANGYKVCFAHVVYSSLSQVFINISESLFLR